MLLIMSVLLGLSVSLGSSPSCCSCLPDGIKQTDVVSYRGPKARIQNGRQPYVSVGEKLLELKARCKRGKLVDGTGREIRFFHLSGCWGNPPEGYQEILAKQNRELIRLRKRYTVVEMTCNTSGEQIS